MSDPLIPSTIEPDLAKQIRQVTHFSPVGPFPFAESGRGHMWHDWPERSTRSWNGTKLTLVISSCVVRKGPLESLALVVNCATDVESPHCCIFPMQSSLSNKAGKCQVLNIPCVIYADLLPDNNKVITLNWGGWVCKI